MRCMLTANLAVDMRFANGTQARTPARLPRVLVVISIIVVAIINIIMCCFPVAGFASLQPGRASVDKLLAKSQGSAVLLESGEHRQQEGAAQLESRASRALCKGGVGD